MTCLEIEIRNSYKPLLEKAVRITGDRQTGQDVLQEIMMRAWNNNREALERMACLQERKGSMYYYLYRAIYLSWRYHRARLKLHTHFEQLTPDIEDNYHQDVYMGDRITNEYLDGLITRLDEYDAELLRLSLMPGFSFEVTSELTGIPISHLYKSVNDSKRKIREYVGSASSKVKEA